MARGGGGGPLVLADCGPAWPADPGTGGSAGKLRAHSAVPGSPPTQQSNIPGHAEDRSYTNICQNMLCCVQTWRTIVQISFSIS